MDKRGGKGWVAIQMRLKQSDLQLYSHMLTDFEDEPLLASNMS